MPKQNPYKNPNIGGEGVESKKQPSKTNGAEETSLTSQEIEELETYLSKLAGEITLPKKDFSKICQKDDREK